MSQKHVVRRTSTNNRRKNTDGDRSDSGCFEDVDVLQMASRPCRSSASSPIKSSPIPDGQQNEKTDKGSGDDRRCTGNQDIPTETPSNPDECAEDKEFLAMLERLAEVTKNPGDLYRLCFSSRLSFCGLDLGGIEDEGSLPPPEVTSRGNGTDNRSAFVPGDISTAQSDTAVQTRAEPYLIGEAGDAVVEHRNCENREECVQLLSMLSSFVKKAKEKPSVFNQSGLGRSLFGQLSSLLTTLEEAKENPNFSNSGVQPENPNNSLPNNLQPPALGGNTDSVMPEQYIQCNSEKEPSVLLPSDFTDDATVAPPVFHDVIESMVSHDNEESPPQLRHQDGDHVLRADLENVENVSAEESGEQSDNVVTSGRRAVTPYSWDYGDIWEKELQRAQSTDSFPPERYGEPGSNMPGDPLMPTFEEIRDELFHDAGFGLREGGRDRAVVSKRRSRSADARSNGPFRNEASWPECEDQAAGHSPFVRTVYQQGFYPNSRLTRSGSSLLPEGMSMTVNLDKNQGRQVRVYAESPASPRSGQLDDSLAVMVKEAVTGTSTFRGPKPWSMLTRRPSSLGRRSNSQASSETLCSTEFPRTRLDSHGDSESSDSPNYVSTASSDCLTTDDSSSLTSSHYCAASSAQSSPTVSNRNSACFSDTGSYLWDKYPMDKYPVGCESRMTDRLFADDANTPRMERWDMSLDQRFGRIGRNSRAFSEPGDNRQSTKAKNHLRKSYQRAENYRGSDPSALRNLQHNTKWSREGAPSSLIVKSDSDLNHLARVQFVGDSYSRSHISKNLRYARQTSRSPSPCARSAHARVLSCEIVQSDKNKRDVYTKVNLSRTVHDEETTVDDTNSKPRSGRDGTRRNWHERSPQRGFPRRNQTERHAYTAGLVDRRRQIFRPQKAEQEAQSVRATLVEVKNIRGNHTRPYNSTGSFRSSCDSDGSRHWSEFRAPACGRGEHYDNSRQFPRTPMASRNSSFGRAEVHLDELANAKLGPSCRRMRADQASASSGQPSGSEKKKEEMVQPCRRQEGLQNVTSPSGAPENTRAKDRHSPVKIGNGSKGNSKEPATHIVKETSFVGPSTFTKYQSPSTRRSKSFNEKDSPSRRRAQQSEAYRRKVLEKANDHPDVGDSPDLPLPSEPDRGVVLRPERRRRHSEGSWKASGSEDTPSAYVVDESYCDPRRESIREGTYSIISAESARVGTKSARVGTESARVGMESARVGAKSGGGCLETPPKETPPAKDCENKIIPDQFQNPVKKNNSERSYLEQEREDGKNKNDLGKHLSKDNVELERKNVHKNVHKDVEPLESSCKVQAMKLNCIGKRGSCKDGENTSPKAPAVSPVWRAKEECESSSGVNVFIDYRSKRPVSVEYEVAESRPENLSKSFKLGFLNKSKANAKQSTKDKPVEEESHAAYVVEDLQPALVADVKQKSNDSAEEFPRKRLSRKEKHMLDISSSFAQVYENETKPCEDFKVLPEPSSPVPYRRDKTIVYTDARLSVDSDTDSVSHDSTVSSSGSDVTVILNDDTDITADDFKQLAQNGSEIGIEIGSLELDSGDDFPESPDSTQEKNSANTAAWTAKLDGSSRSGSEVAATNYFSSLSRSSKELGNKGSLTRPSRDPGCKDSFVNKEIGNNRSFTIPPKETGNNRGFAFSAKGTGSNRSFAHSSKESGSNRSFTHSPKETGNNRSFAIPPNETGNNRVFVSPPKETGNNRDFAFPLKETGNDGMTAEPFKQGSKLRDIYLKYEQSVGELHSTADQKNAELASNTSSHECGKESGTSSSECSKGKHSSAKNGESGKGLFSKLKNIRNSFRGKKTEGKCVEKSGKNSKLSTKKAGKTPDIRHNLGSRSLPIFDSNSNEMCAGAYEVPKLTDRTKSIDFNTKGSSNEELTLKGDLSRTVDEGTLRSVGGLLSMSSDQLNSLRVKIPSKKEAKSLEVLLETCI